MRLIIPVAVGRPFLAASQPSGWLDQPEGWSAASKRLPHRYKTFAVNFELRTLLNQLSSVIYAARVMALRL
jgi:hypothetical protein